MKVAISATGNTLESMMDQRFGRAAFFLIVDSETMEYEAVNNQGAASSGGAGITSAQTVVDKGVEAVISGSIGPNAMNVLNAAKVGIYRGESASARQNVEKFQKGMLEKLNNAVPAHSGMGTAGK